jgi:hypothetical protein
MTRIMSASSASPWSLPDKTRIMGKDSANFGLFVGHLVVSLYMYGGWQPSPMMKYISWMPSGSSDPVRPFSAIRARSARSSVSGTVAL